jgi:caffeoyl-CoA O-methyltransferase
MLLDAQIAEYAAAHTTPAEGMLADVAAATEADMPHPQMMSGLAESRLLEALIAVAGARRVLEVGTFTGFGALTMAAALAEGGEVVTIERDRETAAIARRHIDADEHGHKITLIVGDAREEIGRLRGPFDLIYIDAWKSDYPVYYDAALPLLSPHGILAADNALLGGTVLDPHAEDHLTLGMQAFNERVQADERVRNVLLTVGDGFMLAWWANPAGAGAGG